MTADTEKAYKIVDHDLSKSIFVQYPFERQLVLEDKAAWLLKVKQDIESGAYLPGVCEIAEVPKGKGAVRPGSILTIRDMVAYTSIVNAAFEKIHNALQWPQGIKDFAYTLAPTAHEELWFKGSYNGWERFRGESLRLIEENTSYVVVTDITGFYENIDHSVLFSDLRQLNIDGDVIGNIRKCLKSWSPTETKGIPQGISASHLLAKLYLDPIDRELNDLGYRHTRYSDDFRIFCADYAEAKRVLMVLSKILRQRGLNLQSAKSRIVRADIVKPEFGSSAEIIENIMDEMTTPIPQSSPYPWDDEYEEIVPTVEQIDAIKRGFSNYFAFADDSTFDKSLFHYLLNQLGAASDGFAQGYCLAILEKHPEETSDILKYFQRLDAPEEVIDGLLAFMDSQAAVYDYQNFLILEWFSKLSLNTDKLLERGRSGAFDGNKPEYYRVICKKILADFGTPTDLDRIKREYSTAVSTLEACAVICCMKRLESGRRNPFITQVQSTSEYHRIAGVIAKR
jgi:retron-type reverse transcriptase